MVLVLLGTPKHKAKEMDIAMYTYALNISLKTHSTFLISVHIFPDEREDKRPLLDGAY